MKRALRFLSAAIVVLAVLSWLAGGRPVWTQTKTPVKVVDEVTGLEGEEWRKTFRPGLDVVALTAAMAGLVWGISGLMEWRRKK